MLIRISLLFVLLSCASRNQDPYDFDRRDLQDYFIGSGVVRYFLPNLPTWANYSQTGQCQRQGHVRYLDLEKLRGNFDLDYEQSIQFQYMFNREYKRVTQQSTKGILPFKEEETLFYNVSDKIQSQFKAFKEPNYKRIHLVWIDLALGSSKIHQKLVSLMKSEQMNKGHPIFISLCLDERALNKFIAANNFNHPGLKIIPSEMFSIYGLNSEKSSHFVLDIGSLFAASKELHLYIPGKKPREIIGQFKIHRF